MHLDDWQALGIVCGSLIALLTLIGLLYRWVVRPVWRTLRRLNLVADQLLGDKVRKIPSMTDRMKAIERGLQEHLDWHRVAARHGGAPPVRPEPTTRREA